MQSARYFYPIWTKCGGFFEDILKKVSNIKFHGHPSSGSRVDTRRRTDRQTVTTKLVGAFRYFCIAPTDIEAAKSEGILYIKYKVAIHRIFRIVCKTPKSDY